MSLLVFTLVLNQFSYRQSSVLVATVSWLAESDEIKTQRVVFTQQAKEPWTAEVFRSWTGVELVSCQNQSRGKLAM